MSTIAELRRDGVGVAAGVVEQSGVVGRHHGSAVRQHVRRLRQDAALDQRNSRVRHRAEFRADVRDVVGGGRGQPGI